MEAVKTHPVVTDNPADLITDNVDIWTDAIKTRSASGRGSSKKLDLYGIKKLRELILELAVRGQLVPQDPNDEPASMLLERIDAEKARLVKEKKIKKPKPLPEITEGEKPFELPQGWAFGFMPQVVANDKYAIKRGPFGSALKKAYFVPSGKKVYEQQHAIKDDFSLGHYYVSHEKFEELKAFEVKPNDLIISCSGTVGKVAIAPNWMEGGIINQALLKLTLNENALTNNYFKILFPAFFMQTETLSDLQGTAQKNMVSVDTLKNEPFPLPPLAEQHRIVAKVDELMALCDQLEQQTEARIDAHATLVETLLATLTNSTDAAERTTAKDGGSVESAGASFDQNWTRIADHFDTLFTTEHSIDLLKQTVLQLAVMGKLVPQDPNDEPASVLLERIAAEKAQRVKAGKMKPAKVLPDISESEKSFDLPQRWEWVRFGNIYALEYGDNLPKAKRSNSGEFNVYGSNGIVGTHSAPSVSAPCIVIGRKGSAGALNLNEECGCWVTDVAYSCVAPTGIDMKFAFKQMHTFGLDNLGKGIKPGLNRNEAYVLVIAVPPLAEQHRIVAKVDELMALCDQLKERLQQVQQLQVHLADELVSTALV